MFTDPARVCASSLGQVCRWTDEVARLEDMEDQLLDFRRKLFFYSNLEYIEARRYWDHAIAK